MKVSQYLFRVDSSSFRQNIRQRRLRAIAFTGIVVLKIETLTYRLLRPGAVSTTQSGNGSLTEIMTSTHGQRDSLRYAKKKRGWIDYGGTKWGTTSPLRRDDSTDPKTLFTR